MIPLIYLTLLTTPVIASVESSLPTAGGDIRQFAFDGKPSTVFVSNGKAKKDDHLTLAFDRVIDVQSLSVATGRADDEDTLKAGVLEVSADGKTFETVAKFAKGQAKDAAARKVRAIRVRATEDLASPLVVGEIVVESLPKVEAFQFPIEISLDVTDAPDMQTWAEKVVRVCEQQYPMICRELASEGYKPPTTIRMAFKSDYNGVAEAAGNRIRGSVKYFKDHPKDVGAMVHETAHCVQQYRSRGNPGWLVEGVADYIRFWKFEPGTAGRLTPERARYDGSYRTTAAFLAFISDNYDAKLVTKLNAQMRVGKYNVDVWKEITGKPIEELNQEWRRSLVR
ncbi:basic secretory protein-like protein [Limnoglobus roseus]|uniref:Secretory protein n=1 Tax=Limnoglobus roseus TaxID=2598579 RepID=A0A5C1AJT3_9BACT|nr:basic secretory protein-like protein [Limnoglobus roseus]QEL19659.1 secretory protein [Limnoglobus roseus]